MILVTYKSDVHPAPAVTEGKCRWYPLASKRCSTEHSPQLKDCMSTSHGKPAGNPAARTAQQQAARNAQIQNEQNRQRQLAPANPEPPDDDAEADSE
jgi:hypothetical protein